MLNLIWDLDGTLIDSQDEILYYLKLALKDSSLKITDQIKPIRTGPPIDIMLKESFPVDILSDDKITEILLNFRKRYDSSGFTMTKPFDGIDIIISDTDNFVHHIVTNKPHTASQSILNKLGWTGKISSLKTPIINTNQRKSKTELFSELITESGADISSFIGIGDMKSDCFAARDNNITTVGVLWGSGTREELSGCCDCLFEDTKQLHDFLYDISRFKRSA
jgi:phosphoglycolate phosphatase